MCSGILKVILIWPILSFRAITFSAHADVFRLRFLNLPSSIGFHFLESFVSRFLISCWSPVHLMSAMSYDGIFGVSPWFSQGGRD